MSSNKGIIYCRVSSQEQVQGTSLENQKEACLNYANSKGIEIAKVFIEKGESATAANRTELIKTLDFCKEHKGEINAFIVWKIDRFARNTVDHYGLQAQLIKYGTSLHSVTEPMISEGGPAGRVLEAVLAGFAQFENDIRKQRCEGGMQRKITEGIWPWQPPIGYICAKKLTDRRKNRPDEIDSERFYLIQKGLREYSKGNHSIASLTKLFNRWGLRSRSGKPMFTQLVERVLIDKFYAGILVNPWTKDEHKGLHQSMINLEEYRQIQLIKSGRSNNRAVLRKTINLAFPLRGTVLCGCGNKLTGSWHTGRSKKYPYYQCHNKNCEDCNITIPKEELENRFLEFLVTITPSEKFLNLFQKVFMRCWNDRKSCLQQEKENTNRLLKRLEGQKDQLFQMRLNGEVSTKEFIKLKENIENQIVGIRISNNETKIDELDLETSVTYAVQFTKNLSRQWQDMNAEQKQQLQRMVLPKGVTYNKNIKSFDTAILGGIAQLSKEFSGVTTKDTEQLVAGVGFAPTTFGL